jgi:hypothetical protein
MNGLVKSHWRLVWSCLKKALKVTLDSFKSFLKAHIYRAKVQYEITKQRILFKRLDEVETIFDDRIND